MKLLPFFVVALILTGAPGIHAQKPAPPMVTHLGTSGATVKVRVDFAAPVWVEAEAGGRSYRYPSWPGLAGVQESGSPSVPEHHIRVAVPADGTLTLSYDTRVRGSGSNIRFPPVPTPTDIDRTAGRRRESAPSFSFREGPLYDSAEVLPPVEIVFEGMDRGVRTAVLAVRPVGWNASTGAGVWFEDVTVRIQAGGKSLVLPGQGRSSVPDPAGETSWRATLVNPEDAVLMQAAAVDSIPVPPLGGIPDVWFNDAPGWVKIHIGANGVYRLDRNALENAGVPVSTLDPQRLRLFSGPLIPQVGWAAMGWDTVSAGFLNIIEQRWEHVFEQPGFEEGFGDFRGFEEVAIWVRGEEDGVLDASDDVIFYGLGADNYRDRFGLPLDAKEDYLVNPYTNETVYWLSWDTSLPGPPRRMAAVDATPQPGAETTTAGRARVHVEENTIYDPSLFLGGYRWDAWFWEFIEESGQGKNIDLPHAVEGSTIDAHARLWGSRVPTSFSNGEDSFHHIKVDINDVEIGVYRWGGSSLNQAITPQDVIATGIPVRDVSRFEFRALPVNSADPDRSDQAELAWIDVDYLRKLQLDGQPGELEIDPGTAGRTLEISTPPAGSPLVFDVGDFRDPRRLTGGLSSGSGSSAKLQVAMDRSEGTVVATTGEGAFLSPLRLELDAPPAAAPGSAMAVHWLRDTSKPLDYVIITHDDFAEEGEMLAEWRRDHLFPYTPGRAANVRVILVSDIMDEFAWGMWDPVALRYFLEYAYRYYGNPGDDPLAYCLFLGDSTFDPKDYDRTGVPDLVPSWQDNRDSISGLVHGNVQYTSDDPLARFDGRDPAQSNRLDAITDLYLGRIPVNSKAQAREIILNKIIATEKSPAYGAWRTKAVLVADDVCQGVKIDRLGFVHMDQTESVAEAIPSAFKIDKVYLYEFGEECESNAKPAAKQSLLTSWGDGAWLVNYIGHGGAPVWADEHVLDVTDSPALANTGRLPVMGAFSCSVGKFANPHVVSIGEALLLAPNGSLASAAATHITLSSSNFAFNLRFVDLLFPGEDLIADPIGVALMNAKRFSNQSIKYVFLGDPASRLNIPELSLEITGPAQLGRGTVPEIRAEVEGNAGRSGNLDLLVQDAQFLRTTNSQGESFCEHAQRLGVACPQGIRDGYHQPGSLIYRGRHGVTADTARVSFTVPLSLRGGDDASIRGYAWGEDWDAFGSSGALTVSTDAQNVLPDSLGPVITFSTNEGSVFPGETVEVTLEDESGINLTELFEFRSIVLKLLDERGLEQLRQNLTPGFTYDEGSHTRGTVAFTVPDLSPGPYSFSVSAFDNYNHRTVESITLELGGSVSGDGIADVITYPNPFNPDREPARVMFALSRPAEVTIRIYTVAGRLVRSEQVDALAGRNAYVWDGRDDTQDPVGNGVYLVQLTAALDGKEPERHLERVLVLR